MSEKKSPKVNLEARLINFFLFGCVIGLTISLLALDIWASEKKDQNRKYVVENELELTDESLDFQEKQEEQNQPEKEEEEPEKKEEVEQVLKDVQQDVANSFTFSMETDADAVIEEDDEEVSTETDGGDQPEEPVVRIPQVRAEFPGGMAELKKYLAANCQYPPAARDAGWQGLVMLEFVVEKDGSISQVTVLRSVCQALDDEAIRVVKNMPKWKPGENNGQRCRSFFQLPVTFSLQ